jgi:hypothetical protein
VSWTHNWSPALRDPNPLAGVDTPGRDDHAPHPLPGVPGQDLPAGTGSSDRPGTTRRTPARRLRQGGRRAVG